MCVFRYLCGLTAFYRGCLTDGLRVAAATLPQCRLEANYAHQQELDMIPLMMQRDYSPKGWRKSQYRALRLLSCCRHAVDVRDNDDRSGSDFGHTHVVCNVGRGERR